MTAGPYSTTPAALALKASFQSGSTRPIGADHRRSGSNRKIRARLSGASARGTGISRPLARQAGLGAIGDLLAFAMMRVSIRHLSQDAIRRKTKMKNVKISGKFDWRAIAGMLALSAAFYRPSIIICSALAESPSLEYLGTRLGTSGSSRCDEPSRLGIKRCEVNIVGNPKVPDIRMVSYTDAKGVAEWELSFRSDISPYAVVAVAAVETTLDRMLPRGDERNRFFGALAKERGDQAASQRFPIGEYTWLSFRMNELRMIRATRTPK